MNGCEGKLWDMEGRLLEQLSKLVQKNPHVGYIGSLDTSMVTVSYAHANVYAKRLTRENNLLGVSRFQI